MKKSEMLEHIEAELTELVELLRITREAPESIIRRKAVGLLDMQLWFGMLPPTTIKDSYGDFSYEAEEWEEEDETK